VGLPLFKDIKIEGIAHIDHLKPFLPSDPVILEAGGHEGEDTIEFAKNWPMGSIFTFEPNPRAYRELLNRCAGYPQIHPFPLALDITGGTKTFYLCQGPEHSPEKEGGSSLLPSSPYMIYHFQGDTITVESITLDSWCEAERIDRIDFMWLDLEGKELDVLKSGPNILNTTNIIYTETNLQEFRINCCTFTQLKKYLEDNDFILVAHWYIKDWQGDALFIKRKHLEEINMGKFKPSL
jgi:FkbM family methyltransferase